MAVISAAGTTISISSAAPATFNVAGFEALTWSAIGEITDGGEFGRVYELIRHNPIGTRATRKFKGSYDSGSMSIQLAVDYSDAGQDIVRTAAESDSDYSMKVLDQEGNAVYFQAKVMGFRKRIGTVNNIISATMTIEVTANSTGADFVTDEA